MISFTVEVTPIPAPRPRFKIGVKGKAQVYSERSYEDYKKVIAYTARQATGGVIWSKPVRLDITFRRNLSVDNTNFGDCDNLAKGVMDALNKIVYDDDKQVKELFVHKMTDENEGIDVIVFYE